MTSDLNLFCSILFGLMKSFANVLLNAANRVSRLLYRDFHELRMLRASGNGLEKFVNQSCLRTKQALRKEIGKYTQSLFFIDETLPNLRGLDDYILGIAVDGSANLARGNPFFGTILMHLRDIDNEAIPLSAVLNFPALNELVLVERGRGVASTEFGEGTKKTRLRVSDIEEMDSALVVSDSLLLAIADIKEANVRCFGCSSYHSVMFAAGRSDILQINKNDFFLEKLVGILATESGGSVLSIQENILVASNQKLAPKIKSLI